MTKIAQAMHLQSCVPTFDPVHHAAQPQPTGALFFAQQETPFKPYPNPEPQQFAPKGQ
jgi:hypothetical protein